MKPDKTYSLEDIATLVELPRRTVRYYIQSGLVDRPQGIGKGAYYTQAHVEQLLMVRKWQLAGLSLERIAEVMKQPASGLLPPAPRRQGTVDGIRTDRHPRGKGRAVRRLGLGCAARPPLRGGRHPVLP